MQVVALDRRWGELIEERWIAEMDDTFFLGRCRRGEVTLAELHSFVRQQYYYSRHFTRYLCALLSNLNDESDRIALTHNLFEEAGLGDFGSVPHSQIYREMMSAMGITPEAEPILHSTQALVDAMMAACRHPDPMVGLAALCLGAEAIVPHLYSQIVRGFLSCGEKEENLVFFRIHIEGDDEHAVTMREIIERELKMNPLQTMAVQMTARRLIAARVGFLRGLTPEVRMGAVAMENRL